MKNPMTIQDFSKLGNAKRWGNLTPEQRKKATAPAIKARKRAAKARRVLKEIEDRKNLCKGTP